MDNTDRNGRRSCHLILHLLEYAMGTAQDFEFSEAVIRLHGVHHRELYAGHPRIRNQFQEHLATTKAIAFVVDASTISRNGPAVAECVSP